MGEQIIGAAVQLAGRNDIVAAFRQRLDGISDRGHAGGDCQCRHSTFHRRHALLQYIRGGVHDAGIDIAGNFEIEQVRAMLRIVKGVRSRLVNGNGNGLGGGVWLVAGMQGQCLKFHS